jgi:hypothetical protein
MNCSFCADTGEADANNVTKLVRSGRVFHSLAFLR